MCSPQRDHGIVGWLDTRHRGIWRVPRGWRARTLRAMTSKERLRAFVEELPEEQAGELLRLASELFAVPGQRHPLPTFVGIGDSGRSDGSQQVDDDLAEGFGR